MFLSCCESLWQSYSNSNLYLLLFYYWIKMGKNFM